MTILNTLLNITIFLVAISFNDKFNINDLSIVLFFGNFISFWCISLYIVKREPSVKKNIKYLFKIKNNTINVNNRNITSNNYYDPIKNTETYFKLYQKQW
uniref:Uncharacterized protein n=1 Tax=Strongyloides stercoralis TaxID=6248 RepID=A0AAF5I1Z2_STRER